MLIETIAASALAGKALEKIAEKLAETFTEKTLSTLEDKLKSIDIKELSSNIATYYRDIKFIKTIWQIDKSVDIYDFYCIPHLEVNKTRKRIETLEDISNTPVKFVIQGLAGQGKSTLAKFLCLQELEKNKICIFIELRKIQNNQSIIDYINESILFHYFNLDRNTTYSLLKNLGASFYLDGFDEVAEDNRKHIITEIEKLNNFFKDSNLIITSRPNSGVEYINNLQVIKIAEIINDEYKYYIKKLSHDSEYASSLIKSIEASSINIKNTLNSPLLITLLIVIFKAGQVIPESIPEYYEQIFDVMLERHDGTKPSYKREFACNNLSKKHRKDIFATMCYILKIKYANNTIRNSFTQSMIEEAIEKTPSVAKLNIDSSHFFEDLLSVLCLLAQDGEEVRFIHKSIQEYFFASYVSKLTLSNAIKFYDKVFSKKIQLSENELKIINIIDEYRFLKNLYLPSLIYTKNNILESTYNITEGAMSTYGYKYENIISLKDSQIYSGNRGIIHTIFELEIYEKFHPEDNSPLIISLKKILELSNHDKNLLDNLDSLIESIDYQIKESQNIIENYDSEDLINFDIDD